MSNAEATYVKVKNQIVDNGVTYLVTAIAPKAFMKESCIEKVLIRKNVKRYRAKERSSSARI